MRARLESRSATTTSSRAPRGHVHIATSYREAGHAIAAWHLQIMLNPMSIFRNGKGAGANVWNDALRNVNFDWVRSAESDRMIERLATVLIAGPVAQRLYAESAPRGEEYSQKTRDAKMLIKSIPTTRKTYANRFDRVASSTERFFAQKRVVAATHELSGRLLFDGTIQGDDAMRLIESAMAARPKLR